MLNNNNLTPLLPQSSMYRSPPGICKPVFFPGFCSWGARGGEGDIGAFGFLRVFFYLLFPEAIKQGKKHY